MVSSIVALRRDCMYVAFDLCLTGATEVHSYLLGGNPDAMEVYRVAFDRYRKSCGLDRECIGGDAVCFSLFWCR